MILRIHLLGQPSLLLDDTLLQFNAPPKTLPLLGYLLLHRERVIERQQLAFALWPDDPESDARAKLRRHIHQLLRVLPQPAPDRPWLLVDAQTLRWNPQSDCWLDIAEFEALSAQPARLEEALPLYTGDLLENVYDDWVFFERERLRNLFLDILSRVAAAQRAARNLPKAIQFTQHILLQDPFREDALRRLVSLRYETGDRAGALQEYESFERRLRDEMGVAPMPESRTLIDLVRRNARLPAESTPSGEAECATPSTRPASPNLLPFVGREDEMQLAATRWSRAVRGHGGLLLVSGEAGVGKSRLAREIALNVESQGGRVLFGGVSPSQTRAYQPFVEAFESSLPLLEGLDFSPTRLAALAALIPQLHQGKKLPSLPSLEPDRERIRLFDAVAACLEALSGPRPLLFILEDLHWAGEATLDLLEFLARRAAGRPILLLGTYRDEETPRAHPLRKLRRSLQSESLAGSIALGRLSAAALQCLLSQIPAALLPRQADLSTRLFAESEGHPLLIDQLLDHWRQPGQSASQSLPGGIRAAILSRLARLPEESRAYAEVASVLGPAFDAEAVREVGGWDEAPAHNALSSLLDSHLARDTEGRSHFDYVFTHHLIQSALYEEIPTPKRKRRHLRAAEVLQELFPERRAEMLGELARHFDLGGDAARAIPCYLENARRQVALFADSEALASIQRALELGEKGPALCPPQTQFDFLSLRVEIYSRKGLQKERWNDLLRLQALADILEDRALEFQVLKRQIEYQRDMRDLPAALALVEKLRLSAAKLNTPYWYALCNQVEGQINIANNTHAQAAPLLQQALATWEQLGDRSNQLYCLCYIADIVQMQRQAGEVEILLQKALALCDEHTSPSHFMRALLSAANSGVINNDPLRILRYANQLVALAERVGDLGYQASGSRLVGIAYRKVFRIPEARASLEKAAQTYLSIQRLKFYAMTLESLGNLEISIGRYEEARRFHQQSYEISLRLAQPDTICTGLINLAVVCSLQQDHVKELEYAQKAVQASRQLGNRYFESLSLQSVGNAEFGSNHLDAALEHFKSSLGIMRELNQLTELVSILADIAQVKMKMGRGSDAVQCAQEFLALYPQIEGTDDNLHRHLWIAALIFHAAGRAEKAAQLLAQAYQEYQKALDAIPDAESRQAFASILHNRQISLAHDQALWP